MNRFPSALYQGRTGGNFTTASHPDAVLRYPGTRRAFRTDFYVDARRVLPDALTGSPRTAVRRSWLARVRSTVGPEL